MTYDEIRRIWREKGGSFHGPNVETGTMPEHLLLPWLQELMSVPDQTLVIKPASIHFGGGISRYTKKAQRAAERLAGMIEESPC